MRAVTEGADTSANDEFLELFGDVSDAVESGAGLPEVARAAGRALAASVVVVDAGGSILAVACASPADEHSVLAGTDGSERLELRVADSVVGRLLHRARGERPPAALLRMVGTLMALEVERSRGPERASEVAVGVFLTDLLDRRLTEREDIEARGRGLGIELCDGASVLIVRAHPQQPEEGDWRRRVLAVAERGARGIERSSLTAWLDLSLGRTSTSGGGATSPTGDSARGRAPELVIVAPTPDGELAGRTGAAVLRELEAGLPHFTVRVTRSRPAADPADLHRAGAEALLAANVAEANGSSLLAFEETGAYRVLLPSMTDNPEELQRFHDETVAPVVAYDEQYETPLVRTLEAFLEADGNVARTAQKLFTHRHTIRYRLERVRDLSGFDVTSSDGRESLSIGLKAMRVLGINPPGGPATEPGTEAGRIRREGKDR
jgi:hypothetical protein